jgi:hypothetical protein
MFGLKIMEFDNTDGTVESFNKIFSNTPLDGTGEVEILGITRFNNGNLYMRDISLNGEVFALDFGEQNFVNPNYFAEDKTRFKYVAKDINDKTIATAFNIKELSEKLGCGESIVKTRLVKRVDRNSETRYLFNVTRTEV